MSANGLLIEAIARKDHEAFRKLYERYYRRIYLYALHLLDEEEAQDVANEVMMEVWRGAKRFKGRSQVSTWIFGIAANKARKRLKGRGERAEEEELERVMDEREGPDEQSHRALLKEKFRKALRKLTPEHREVLHLAYYQDLSVKEISEIVGCPLNTVKTRLFYARQRLRTILEEMGIGKEATWT